MHIFDVGVWHERPYLVLEYLEGSPLSEQLAIRRLSPGRATQIMMEIARALDHAHHAGVLHLDLKPHWARPRRGVGRPRRRTPFGRGPNPGGQWSAAWLKKSFNLNELVLRLD